MYTEFYSIWANDPREGMFVLNNRISEIKKMDVGEIEINREREGQYLYVTITYDKRPGDEGYVEDPNNQPF